MRATARGMSRAAALAASLTVFPMVLGADPLFAGRRSSDDDSDGRHSAEALNWSWRLAPGKRIEIKGVNGKIEAEGTTGNEVELTATKRWRRSNPEAVRVEVIEHEGGVTVCAVYPNRHGKPNECEVGSEQHSHVDNNDVVVDYKVRVPRGVGFVGRTVNGGIEADGLSGPIEAYTVNGSVRVSTRDQATVETVNGSITASMGAPSWNGSLEFSTVNGGITLDLPEDVAARLNAETLNGEISSDFPLTLKGRFSRHKISGTIGNADRAGELALSTVNGSIHLRSAP